MFDRYFRDTWAEINLDYIEQNINHVKQQLKEDVQLIAVVKANAYGHGAVEVAKTAIHAGASFLAVAFIDEALVLRKAGIDVPILVLGWSKPSAAHIASEYGIRLTVFQKEWVEEAKHYLKKDDSLFVHLKCDTGMGRIGVKTKEEAKQLIDCLTMDKRFVIEGSFTHFATADEKDDTYFKQQLETFKDMQSWFKDWNISIPMIHASNSATSVRYKEAQFNAVRLGIIMYGLTPSTEITDEIPFPLKEAFSLHSTIVHVKEMQDGEKVSYGATYEAKSHEWIATIPIGYADGWIRKNSVGEVLVDGERVPIVGRVCMDQMMVRLNHPVPIGTKVTLIGSDQDEVIRTDEVAKRLDTINYEIPCIISNRVPRIFVKNGQVVQIMNALSHE